MNLSARAHKNLQSALAGALLGRTDGLAARGGGGCTKRTNGLYTGCAAVSVSPFPAWRSCLPAGGARRCGRCG